MFNWGDCEDDFSIKASKMHFFSIFNTGINIRKSPKNSYSVLRVVER